MATSLKPNQSPNSLLTLLFGLDHGPMCEYQLEHSTLSAKTPARGRQTDRQTGRWADKQRQPVKKETATLLAEMQKVQKWGFKGGAETTIEVNGQVLKVRMKLDNSIPTTSSGHPSSLTPSAGRCLCRSCYVIKLIPIC